MVSGPAIGTYTGFAYPKVQVYPASRICTVTHDAAVNLIIWIKKQRATVMVALLVGFDQYKNGPETS